MAMNMKQDDFTKKEQYLSQSCLKMRHLYQTEKMNRNVKPYASPRVKIEKTNYTEITKNNLECLSSTSTGHAPSNDESWNINCIKIECTPSILECNETSKYMGNSNNTNEKPTPYNGIYPITEYASPPEHTHYSLTGGNYVVDSFSSTIFSESYPQPDESSNISAENDKYEVIGSNGTTVRTKILNGLRWDQYNFSKSVRIILSEFYTKKELSTRSFSGKMSPAFPNIAVKPGLDSKITKDIMQYGVREGHIYGVSAVQIRRAMTSACADSRKIKKKTVENHGDRG